jgi:protein gp37
VGLHEGLARLPHCYADTLAKRYGHNVWGPGEDDRARTFGEKHWHEPRSGIATAEKAGVRRRVFCSSMCDVFEEHPTIDAERAKLWPLIRATPALDWQLLTKRPERIAANLPERLGRTATPNVWLGTSVESQEYAERASAHLD